MHRDMQHTPRVRAFADFLNAEIKSFRALLSNGTEVPGNNALGTDRIVEKQKPGFAKGHNR